MADTGTETHIEFRGVSKTYDGRTMVVQNLDLRVRRGEFFTLLGPSGSGKTTCLMMLAGFEVPTAGEISINGRSVQNLPPRKRGIGVVFQNYALFPHMTVGRNLAFPLEVRGVPAEQGAGRVRQALEIVRLEGLEDRRPGELSGGQQQRVAIARALVFRPTLVLMDEPLGALDRRLREEMQFELINIQQTLGITFVVVTHDQEEAMTLSSRIGVMHAGRIVQTGTPTQIYEYPRSRFVAQFVGSVNLFEGRVEERAPDHVLIASEKAGCTLAVEHVAQVAVGAPVAVAVRPEKLVMAHEPPGHEYNHIPAIVDEVAYRGGLSIYKLRIATGHTLHLTQPNRDRATVQRPAAHDAVFVSWHPASGVVLDS